MRELWGGGSYQPLEPVVPAHHHWATDGVAVYPLRDLRQHIIHDPECWCRPTDNDGLLVHHSMDRREEYENGRKAS